MKNRKKFSITKKSDWNKVWRDFSRRTKFKK